MARERESSAEICLDLRVSPPCDVVLQAALFGKAKVVEPAQKVEVRFARLGISEPDVLVDEHLPGYETQVVAEEPLALAILEDDAVVRFVLKHGAKKVRAQEIEVELALAEYVQVERVVLVQYGLMGKTVVSAWHDRDLDRPRRAGA
jgi:hypothetical protein